MENLVEAFKEGLEDKAEDKMFKSLAFWLTVKEAKAYSAGYNLLD